MSGGRRLFGQVVALCHGQCACGARVNKDEGVEGCRDKGWYVGLR